MIVKDERITELAEVVKGMLDITKEDWTGGDHNFYDEEAGLMVILRHGRRKKEPAQNLLVAEYTDCEFRGRVHHATFTVAPVLSDGSLSLWENQRVGPTPHYRKMRDAILALGTVRKLEG